MCWSNVCVCTVLLLPFCVWVRCTPWLPSWWDLCPSSVWRDWDSRKRDSADLARHPVELIYWVIAHDAHLTLQRESLVFTLSLSHNSDRINQRSHLKDDKSSLLHRSWKSTDTDFWGKSFRVYSRSCLPRPSVNPKQIFGRRSMSSLFHQRFFETLERNIGLIYVSKKKRERWVFYYDICTHTDIFQLKLFAEERVSENVIDVVIHGKSEREKHLWATYTMEREKGPRYCEKVFFSMMYIALLQFSHVCQSREMTAGKIAAALFSLCFCFTGR